jgi:hypothetical protein
MDLGTDTLVKPTTSSELQALSLNGVNQYVYKVGEATQYSPKASCGAGSCYLVITFINADGEEQATKGSVLLADAQVTAGRFSFQDLDLDPVQYGGDLYFNITQLNGNASDLVNTVKIYLAKDDITGSDKQLVAERIWNENTLWDGSTVGAN